ncbi:MAG: bifunctional 4-hydroxy-3-methylbut-2-enyl diphosphate reductase/30S ribosomal protein S1, partial [Oscillospiraceae bacterium]|nr:bifunctional 4-hydroxy-3-methylbut-2-enyl diphosphate reductase/30S ribosomal protein S1 [Oscillospiraceae bacterium]
MKELRVAKSAGFCFGVSRSVKMAETMLQDGPCASFGMLIHNEDEIRRLTNSGLRTVECVEEVKPQE